MTLLNKLHYARGYAQGFSRGFIRLFDYADAATAGAMFVLGTILATVWHKLI